MTVAERFAHKILWAHTSKDEVTVSVDDAEAILNILDAAIDVCREKADEIEGSEDETLAALLDAVRAAGDV
jgi:hypothetical protein